MSVGCEESQDISATGRAAIEILDAVWLVLHVTVCARGRPRATRLGGDHLCPLGSLGHTRPQPWSPTQEADLLITSTQRTLFFLSDCRVRSGVPRNRANRSPMAWKDPLAPLNVHFPRRCWLSPGAGDPMALIHVPRDLT